MAPCLLWVCVKMYENSRIISQKKGKKEINTNRKPFS